MQRDLDFCVPGSLSKQIVVDQVETLLALVGDFHLQVHTVICVALSLSAGVSLLCFQSLRDAPGLPSLGNDIPESDLKKLHIIQGNVTSFL